MSRPREGVHRPPVSFPSHESLPKRTGITIVTPSFHIHYMTDVARQHLALIRPPCNGNRPRILLSTAVVRLLQDLRWQFDRNFDSARRESVQATRLLSSCGHPLLIWGVCIPADGSQPSSFLLITHIVDAPKSLGINGKGERSPLTDRQRQVLHCLREGLTDKEIATRLDLSVYTIKGHLKRLRHKTGTETRTGVLSASLRSRGEFTAVDS